MSENTQDRLVSSAANEATALAVAQDEAILWQTRAAYLQAQADRAERARAALQEQNLTLAGQLKDLEAYAAQTDTRLAQAQAQVEAAQVTVQAMPGFAHAVQRPPIADVVDQLPHHPDPSNQYPHRTIAQIRLLILHHTGHDDLMLTPRQLADYDINDPKHQWPGIGAHFFIDADGAIAQTNRLETVCFHVANGNAATLGIMLAGRFSGRGPSDAQLSSTAALVAWLLQELHLPLESVLGHSELSGQPNDCPGDRWLGDQSWKASLLAQVRQLAQAPRRPIYHYLLFWQTETDWADADWQAASGYISRFRPTAGFSTDEARQAENVTIIGGPAGVTGSVEHMLRNAGCRVQRIAGKNTRQTKEMLETMAKAGQRFAPDQAPTKP